MKVVPFMDDVALQSFIVYALVLIIDTYYGLYSDSTHVIASIGIAVA